MALTINPDNDDGAPTQEDDNFDQIFDSTPPTIDVRESTEDADQNQDNNMAKKNQCVEIITNCLNVIFPKVEPISTVNFMLLTFFALIPTAVYFLAFTKVGYGLRIYFVLSEHTISYGYFIGLGLIPYTFLLYLTDCYYWGETTCGDIAKKICIGLLIIGVFTVAIAISGDYPYAPICLYIIMMPLWMTIVGDAFYAKTNTKTFVTWLSGPFLILSFMVFIAWIIWVLWSEDHEWNPAISLAEADESGCEPNFDDHPECEADDGGVCFLAFASNSTVHYPEGCDESCNKVYDSCLNTFILWASPLFISCGLLFLSYFSTFLRVDGSTEQDVIKFSKLWLSLLFATWVYASLAGAASGIATALAALTLAGFIASAVFLSVSYSQIERMAQYEQTINSITLKFGSWFDVARGLLVVTCSPLFFVAMAISALKQRIRSIPCFNVAKAPIETSSMRDVGGKQLLTVEFRRIIRNIQSWNKSKVYTNAILWGLLFMSVIVIVAQFTVLFLTWLIQETSDMSLFNVTYVIFLVGLTMFLLPPVSGVPIYVVLGIVILPAGRDQLGIWGCFGYAMAVSLVLKLTACAMQQKLIGECLRSMTGVRRLCGVNTTVVRATKLNLAEKGLGLAKVSILVGMPDWPTSVLCGIMHLKLLPILVGTLPIVILQAPTLLVGFFTYMMSLQTPDEKPEFPWAGTLAAISTAVTALVQFGSMIIAAYYVEKTTSTRANEIEAMPIDEEVKLLDDKRKAVSDMYTEVTQWDQVPLWAKICLVTSLGCMIMSCYMVQFFQDQCFTPYELTSTIDEHLDGDWTNLVKPVGIVAISLFIFSLVLLYIYISWANIESKRRVNALVASRSTINIE